jgi:predicted ester cyclase
MLPSFLNAYLWDTDPASIDIKTHARFIIERLLEEGDGDAVRWVFETYPKETIIEIILTTRRLSRRSAFFWTMMLDIPTHEVTCLSKSFQRTYRPIWKN